MPRFVILEHDWPRRHWDLLLEDGPVLRAWRLLAEPNAGFVVPAETNADHRLVYLDYEGPVSGDRGQGKGISAGVCRIRKFDDDNFWSIHFPDLQLPRLHLKFGHGDEWLAMLECY